MQQNRTSINHFGTSDGGGNMPKTDDAHRVRHRKQAELPRYGGCSGCNLRRRTTCAQHGDTCTAARSSWTVDMMAFTVFFPSIQGSQKLLDKITLVVFSVVRHGPQQGDWTNPPRSVRPSVALRTSMAPAPGLVPLLPMTR